MRLSSPLAGFDRPMEVFRKPLTLNTGEEVSEMVVDEEGGVGAQGKKETKKSKSSKKQKRKRDEGETTTDASTTVTN